MSFKSSKRYTAVQGAGLILADSFDDSRPLSDFSSDGKESDIDQTAIQRSDSDASNAGQIVSDSESKEESDVVQNSQVTSGHYPTKDSSVIWRKYPLSAAGRPKSCNVINDTVPTNAAPEAFSSPLDAFELTFPTELVDTIMHYRNQRYQLYCRQFPRGSIVNQFHGYLFFTLEEICAFIGLQFVSGANKMGSQPSPNFFTSLQVPRFCAADSRDRLKLIYKFCRFDNNDTRKC